MNNFLKKMNDPKTQPANQQDFHARIRSANRPAAPANGNDRFGGLAAGVLKRLLSKCGDPPLRVILPDGQEIVADAVQPVGTIRIADDRTVWAVALDPLFQFGEAYADGRLAIDGDMTHCLTVLFRIMNQRGNYQSLGQRVLTRLRRPSANSLKGSKENIHHHYDIGNDFYQLWLDQHLVYTCAYFSSPDCTLEQAQSRKMDHVCRKLRLKPGMRVVEAGCGWGALAIHMAKYYGVSVTAFNISREQIAWATERAGREGLAGQVEFRIDDWRDIRGKFDAFVSVGMLEHVGPKNYEQLGRTIRDCLTDDGTGLIHTIGQNSPNPFNSWIERRIFPGAYSPALKEMMQIFEAPDFSVLDVENLRLHYAETLRHWLMRFENSVDRIWQQFGEEFVRMWRLYLAGSVAAFESGTLQLFQVVFANGLSNNVPRTREHIYDSANDRLARVLRNRSALDLNWANNQWNQDGDI